MNQVELTELQRAGKNLRRVGPRVLEPGELLASVDMDHYSVLYLKSGAKVLVQESVAEIERLTRLNEIQRTIMKRFKRELRECKSMGMPVDEAFALLWEKVAAGVILTEFDQAELYQELLDWTKRWLK